MKFSQMKAFREIMLTGSVSEAAKNLNRSQPAVSATISSLEDQLGLKLFDRRNGRLHPVPESHYFLEVCTEVLSLVDRIQQNLLSMKALESGLLKVISMPGPSVFLMPDMISSFVDEKPDVECELISRSSDLVFQLIAAQQYDIGISDHFETKIDRTSLVNAEVFRFDCYCAVHKDDRIAQMDTVTPEMLDGLPIATLDETHEVYKNLVNAFEQRGQQLNIRFRARYFLPLLTFAENRQAYAVVDPIAVESYRLYSKGSGNLVFKPFSPAVCYTTSILRPAHRPASMLSRAFSQELTKKFLALGGRPILK